MSVNSVLNASNVFFSMRMVYLHSYCDLVNESAAHSVNFIAITVIKWEDPQMLAIDVKLHSPIESELKRFLLWGSNWSAVGIMPLSGLRHINTSN